MASANPISDLAQALIALSRPSSPTPSAPSLQDYKVPLKSSASQAFEHQELISKLNCLQKDVSIVVEQNEDIKEDLLEKVSAARVDIIKCRQQVQDVQFQGRTRSSKCQSRCILFLLGSMIFITLGLLVYNTFMDKFERAFGK